MGTEKINLYISANKIIINNFAEKGWCIVDKTDFSKPAKSLEYGKTYLILPFGIGECDIDSSIDFLNKNGIEYILKKFKFTNGKVFSNDKKLNYFSDLYRLSKKISNITDLIFDFHLNGI